MVTLLELSSASIIDDNVTAYIKVNVIAIIYHQQIKKLRGVKFPHSPILFPVLRLKRYTQYNFIYNFTLSHRTSDRKIKKR